ncbi:hypothetical protein Ddye_011866 [Dipteronia dyeriana]|uniref:Uncharacterized protein n=1 Tax=Dipteronia dyeriana TaxID=168575 RepID=A0AAD9X3E0_9ROSI|nr:hypothetical protein Ddye_011866 [Dipteronia dyeriana]
MIYSGLEWRLIITTDHLLSLNFITKEVYSVTCILIAIGKIQGCVRYIESLKPSGASKTDIMNQTNFFLSQDNKYKHGFKYDHVWPTLEDMEKFVENKTVTLPFQRKTSHFILSQEDSLTPESPTMAYPGLSPFSLNIISDYSRG